MKIIDRIKSFFNYPRARPAEPNAYRFFNSGIQAGMHVNNDTALQCSALWAAVNYIANTIAQMPWRAYVERGESKELASGNGVDKLLHRRPNPEMSAFTFRQTLLVHALTWGNGYAEIERDAANRPVALWPVSPDRVSVRRDTDSNRIIYEISNQRDGKDIIQSANMFHVHGLGFDGLVGYSPISLAARGLGVSMAAEQFSASFFQNGTVTGLKVEAPEALSETARQNLVKSLNEAHQGPYQAFKAIVVEEGMKLGNLVMPSKDAELLMTRKFQIEEICRWYNLPPHILGQLGDATFNNIEQLSIEVVYRALGPWAKILEEEADYKLFSDRAPFYTKINFNSLLRGDVAARSTFYREMWNLGVLSVNEIRALEDLNPVDNGDKRFVQLNMTTLEKAGEEPQPQEPALPQPTTDNQDNADNGQGLLN